MSTKIKQPRPRKMWANYYPDGDIVLHGLWTFAAASADPNANYRAIHVAVIPLNDCPAIVRKAMRAFSAEGSSMFEPAMRSALTAIGVLPRSRKGRK